MSYPVATLLAIPGIHRLLCGLAHAGGAPRFIGGCVRDLLLGQAPQDVDIATTLHPEAVSEVCHQAGIHVLPIGIEHGSVVVFCDGQRFEVTTLREDQACDGRHAQVCFTTDWERDAMRRDFTINALSLDEAGTLYDYTHGLADLKRRYIRFIGTASLRIQEDYLRILRFFRFNASYHIGPLDPEGFAACCEHQSELRQLSGTRIHKEMLALLRAARAADMLETLHHHGFFPYIGMDAAIADASILRTYHAVMQALNIAPDPLVGLAALYRAQQLDPSLLLERWSFSRVHAARLVGMVEVPYLGMDATLSRQQHHLRHHQALYRESIYLSWAQDLLQKVPSLDASLLAAEAKASLAEVKAMLDLERHWAIPVFPVSGRDLRYLGVPSGSGMGALLKTLESWWEDQRYEPGREEILGHAQSLIDPPHPVSSANGDRA